MSNRFFSVVRRLVAPVGVKPLRPTDERARTRFGEVTRTKTQGETVESEKDRKPKPATVRLCIVGTRTAATVASDGGGTTGPGGRDPTTD